MAIRPFGNTAPDGNLIEETDANGNTSTYTYDRVNRLTQVTDAGGGITRYQHDPSGNLTKLTDPSGRATSYNYAGCGMLVEETDPSAIAHHTAMTETKTFCKKKTPMEKQRHTPMILQISLKQLPIRTAQIPHSTTTAQETSPLPRAP